MAKKRTNRPPRGLLGARPRSRWLAGSPQDHAEDAKLYQKDLQDTFNQIHRSARRGDCNSVITKITQAAALHGQAYYAARESQQHALQKTSERQASALAHLLDTLGFQCTRKKS